MKRMTRTLTGELWPWLISFVVWALGGAYVAVPTAPKGTEFDGMEGVGWFLLAFIGGARVVKALWPIRLTDGAEPRIVNRRWAWQVHRFTGIVTSSNKVAYTTTTVQSGPQGYVSRATAIQDQLTLVDASMTEFNVTLGGVNLAVSPGQVVSVAWAVEEGKERGAYFYVRNHSDANSHGRFLEAPLSEFGRLRRPLRNGRNRIRDYATAHLGWMAWLWASPLAVLGGVLMVGAGHAWAGVAAVVVPVATVVATRTKVRSLRGRLDRQLTPALEDAAAHVHARPTKSAFLSEIEEMAAKFQARGADAGAASGRDREPAAASTVPPPPPAVDAPAGWFADPLRRHDHRYWDGAGWTDQVADGGTAGSDPL